MASPSAGDQDAARALLRRESRALRGHVLLPVLLGVAATLCALGVAWLTARLLATLLGYPGAGWNELAAAGALAVLGASLGFAQERAQLAAGEAARTRLRDLTFARLLAAGPGDARGVGERAGLVVDRVEALDGYFGRWLPAATLAVLGPVLVIAAASWADPGSGLLLAIAGLLYPVAMAATGIGAAQASRRQFESLERLSGRFLDRMRGLPTLVLFNRQEAEAEALGVAADELRVRTMKVLRVAFLSGTALELLSALALACIAWRHGGLDGRRPDRRAVLPAAGPGLLRPAARLRGRLSRPARRRRCRRRPGAAAARPAGRGAAAGGDATARRRHLHRGPAELRPGPAAGAGWPLLPGQCRGDAGAGRAFGRRQILGAAAADGVQPAGSRAHLDQRPGRHGAAAGGIRRLSSYVGQKPHLFRASLRENIRFARPDATAGQVEAAARAARVLDFARSCRRGWIRWWARAAGASPAARRSGWRWPAPSCATRRWCCSTNPPRISTPAPRPR